MERNSAWSRWCLKIESHVMRGAWRGERRQRTERARRGRRRCVEKGMWHRMGLRPAAGEATVPRSERGRAADGHGSRTGEGPNWDGAVDRRDRGDVRAAWRCDRGRACRVVRQRGDARAAETSPGQTREQSERRGHAPRRGWSEAVRLLPQPEMSPYSFQNKYLALRLNIGQSRGE